MNPNIEIRQYVVGPIETNCYVVIDGDEAMVIDPGASGARLAKELKDLKVKLIVATHGHHDHVCGVSELKAATGARYAISEKDADRACHSLELSSHSWPDPAAFELKNPPEPDFMLHEGDELGVGKLRFKVLEAPGHTPGGVVLLGQGEASGLAFVGDTIFAGSVGRTDLDGGDFSTLMQTIDRLKQEIPADTELLCGHGAHTSMQAEIATNPFFAV